MKHKQSQSLYDGRDFESSFFTSVNRNKRSLTLLKNTEGRKLALDLASKADVIVENVSASLIFESGRMVLSLCLLSSLPAS